MDVHTQFCNNLRILRLQKGWSQENVADMLGISYNGYAKIERGISDVSLSRIKQIAELMEVSIATLLFGVSATEDSDLLFRIKQLELQLEKMKKNNQNTQNIINK